MDLGGWELSEKDDRGDIHCVPINDTKEHIAEHCECCPVRDPELPMLWVHNSFDGREAFEEGRRKLS